MSEKRVFTFRRTFSGAKLYIRAKKTCVKIIARRNSCFETTVIYLLCCCILSHAAP